MQAPRHRPGHAPVPWIADAVLALAGLGFGVVLALVITGESRGSLAAPGGLLTAGGRLAGFAGAYLLLVMVVLIARLPWLERTVGQDQLVRWHRRVAPWTLGLIGAHIVLVTLGYARLGAIGPLRQAWTFITTYPDILAASVAFGSVKSFRISTRFSRMSYLRSCVSAKKLFLICRIFSICSFERLRKDPNW